MSSLGWITVHYPVVVGSQIAEGLDRWLGAARPDEMYASGGLLGQITAVPGLCHRLQLVLPGGRLREFSWLAGRLVGWFVQYVNQYRNPGKLTG